MCKNCEMEFKKREAMVTSIQDLVNEQQRIPPYVFAMGALFDLSDGIGKVCDAGLAKEITEEDLACSILKVMRTYLSKNRKCEKERGEERRAKERAECESDL